MNKMMVDLKKCLGFENNRHHALSLCEPSSPTPGEERRGRDSLLILYSNGSESKKE